MIRNVLSLAPAVITTLGLGQVVQASAATGMTYDGPQYLSMNKLENAIPFMALPEASLGVTQRGSLDVQTISLATPADSAARLHIDHVRNEGGTIFVFLQVDALKNGPLVDAHIPLTLKNLRSGQTVNLMAHLSAPGIR